MRKLGTLSLTVALWLGTTAGKCVGYDERLVPPTALPGGDGGAVVSATPCPDPSEAILAVEEFAFIVRCGCLEPPGVYTEDDKHCTIPVGTTVTWMFQGSQQHNVASEAFADSRPRTTGRYSVPFDTPGVYDYSCSLHIGQMSGYSIIVR
ncbi:MAG: hypothetical protein ACAI38_25590 [Myxococcota bacterium]